MTYGYNQTKTKRKVCWTLHNLFKVFPNEVSSEIQEHIKHNLQIQYQMSLPISKVTVQENKRITEKVLQKLLSLVVKAIADICI